MLLKNGHCVKRIYEVLQLCKKTFFLSSSLSGQICDVIRADMPRVLMFSSVSPGRIFREQI